MAPTLDGRTSFAQKLLVVVEDTRQDIEGLKITIKLQTDVLTRFSTELVSVKTELVTVKTELATVKAELSDAKKQMAAELK